MATANGVVVHLDEADEHKQAAVLGNIRNLLAELADGTRVELVAHGPGLSVCLAGGPNADGVAKLIRDGVVVAACHNTMRTRDIEPDHLVAGVTIVPAGIAELVRKQRDGWAYVRP